MTASPEALSAMIREIVREVIREVVAEEVAAVAAKSGRPAASHARPVGSTQVPPAGPLVERGALTERHVRSAGEVRSITIGAKVVITPLARESARARGIEIIRMPHA